MAVPLTLPHTFPRTGMAGYRFDGVDDRILLPASAKPPTAWTLYAWVRFDDLTHTNAIIAPSLSDFNDFIFLWYDATQGGLRCEMFAVNASAWRGTPQSGGSVVPLHEKRLYCIAATFGGAGTPIKVYVDGELATQTNAIDDDYRSDSGYGFAISHTSRPLEGFVHEVAVFNGALSDEDVRRLYEGRVLPTDYDCRLWLPLYEHHTHDRSGHENHGVSHGAMYEVSG